MRITTEDPFCSLNHERFRASSNAGGPVGSGGTINSPSLSPRFQNHAEEDFANQIDTAIQAAGLTDEK